MSADDVSDGKHWLYPLQIFWCSHDSKLNSSLVSKSLVTPLPDGPEHLDCCDTIVGDENLDTRHKRYSVIDALALREPPARVSTQQALSADRFTAATAKCMRETYLRDNGMSSLCFHEICDLPWCRIA